MTEASGAKLLILCTLAVGAIYTGAYVYTSPRAHHPSATTVSSAHRLKSSGSSRAGSRAAKYKDGTYTGSGANLYGTLSVSVTIVHGRIAAVMITQYNMHYPASFIDPFMNREMIKNQTYRVYAVSGATASSENFAEAVYFALKKARN
ncbi:MAG: FMN-binding protein [Sulfobacillus acidophilus]|uniref:FMN-binding protein n=1 Tax=Sulfobacillus acidophilus TaxID=53633 RepID=A0A2T2WKL6_9FIRM|nr:MAG: FMN-binding protein [Sulfobacillus acidophilus]